MATKHASYVSDDAGKAYDPFDNYGASSDEDQAVDSYQYGYSDEEPEDDDLSDQESAVVHTAKHTVGSSGVTATATATAPALDTHHPPQSQDHMKQDVLPSSVALPTSPVSTRGGRDSYTSQTNHNVHAANVNVVGYSHTYNNSQRSQPASPISSRGSDRFSVESRQSLTHEPEHSAPVTAAEAKTEDRHSSISTTAPVALEKNVHSENQYHLDSHADLHSADAKAERARRHSWEEEESDEEPYQAYNYGRDDMSEEEDDDNDNDSDDSHVQPPSQSLPPSQQANRYSIQSEDSHHHQSHKQHHSDSEDDKDFYSDYGYNENKDESNAQQLHSIQDKHVHEDHQRQGQIRSSIDSYDRRSSLNEQDHRDQHRPLEHESRPTSFQHKPPAAFYDELGEEEPAPNQTMFLNSAVDHRASLSSAKSYSSHTKHHSFGYEDRPVDYGVESDSESDTESSASEPEQPHMSAQALASSRPVSSSSFTTGAAAAASVPAAAVVVAASTVTASSTPQSPPPIPSKSRPTSTFSFASISTSSSPVLSRSTVSAAAPITEHKEINEELAASASTASVAAAAVATSTPAAPTIPAPVSPTTQDRTATPHSPLMVDTVSQKSTSSASSFLEQREKRYSGSDSDTSGTSIDLHSPTYKDSLSVAKRTPHSLFTRTMSSTSAHSREAATGANNHRNSLEKQRPISYATVFSDAELNDVNLLDEPTTVADSSSKRASEIVPPTPSTPSAFGFSSSFFGVGRAQSAAVLQQQQQQQQPSLVQAQRQSDVNTLRGATASPATPIPTPVPLTDTRARSTSISALASSIQGAFSRGFSSQPQPPVPPLPNSRTPSQISQRASNSPATAPMTMGLMDRQFSNNKSAGSDRASTISTQTNDSNMDLLLARLEAQNELLMAQDFSGGNTTSKRRATTESDMDRAIGHAKEENAGEDIDWDYWGALMHDYNTVVKKNPKQLTTMIQRGVPSALRGLIWQLLAKSKDLALEATYAELLKGTSTHEKQIMRDMNRTFPNHEYFQADGVGQEALFNVVKAYSLYDPEVGYCQGLSFIVGPLLLNMPEEEAFCMLVRMMSSYEMRGHYTPDMSVLTLRLFQFEQLMEETVPMIFKHLRNQGIRSTMYASQWFMTLFAYKFPLDMVFRVYDIILVEGIESMLRFAIALLKANHDRILGLDFEVLIEFLKNGLFEHYLNDSGLLIQDAYNVRVTPRKLAQYAQKHQAMIQKQQQELAAEESLKESNRQLSTHVRQLEASLNQLNKEHVDLAKELITRKMEMAQLQDQNDVLTQKVGDLTRIVDSQAKEKEDQYKGEIEDVLRKNMEYLKKNEQLEDQLSYMEGLLVETKMKYAESEIDRDALSRKLSDMRKALAVA
ncbi:GTPase-activating protein [Mortierella claussenii]|nr:GTPase-activating protein [Mortierella claussenii]